jgi:hypothetical protein
MNDCVSLSDRMPEVALGRSDWNPEDAAHLADCAECQAEWRLLVAAAALAESAPTVADPVGLAAALRLRLAQDRAGRTTVRRGWLIGGAAATAAALVLAVASTRPADQAPIITAEADALLPLPELEGLETAQLDTLLNTIDRPVAGTSTLDASTMGEHEGEELEQVFATWEG